MIKRKTWLVFVISLIVVGLMFLPLFWGVTLPLVIVGFAFLGCCLIGSIFMFALSVTDSEYSNRPDED